MHVETFEDMLHLAGENERTKDKEINMKYILHIIIDVVLAI